MKNTKLIIGVVVGVALIGLVAAVVLSAGKTKTTASTTSSSSSTDNMKQADTASAVATNAVAINNYMFGPMVVKVKVGDTVTWTNKDSVHHNIVADTVANAAPNGPLIGENETYSFKFTKAGTYSYHCNPHPYMHGTVVVSE